MFKFDQDDFFNYLVATDQVDDFLGKKEEQENEDEKDSDDELVELDDFDEEENKSKKVLK